MYCRARGLSKINIWQMLNLQNINTFCCSSLRTSCPLSGITVVQVIPVGLPACPLSGITVVQVLIVVHILSLPVGPGLRTFGFSGLWFLYMNIVPVWRLLCRITVVPALGLAVVPALGLAVVPALGLAVAPALGLAVGPAVAQGCMLGCGLFQILQSEEHVIRNKNTVL